ncbi:ABC transporter substrate-binding protein [Paenibacillus alginolyticus]|uniref:ABC transporter substrate-binding protein n=1 Tax=Paenibacillus alginolyticus TaxID=59839 RepID=UPI0022840189|nr:ABC transporter substrate-binding protein [Paenibacillus alginolyticus]MCY9666821.1 ABC transporter substrate-binding protein [Paenibacillus alginolyticus]
MGFLKSRLLLKGFAAILSVVLVISLMGCADKSDVKTTQTKESSENAKRMPESMTKVNLGLTTSRNISYLPYYVAIKKGYFQKYNLDVKPIFVQGGVLALRGLQSGDFQIITTLPESVITGVAEGANVKLIGTLDIQSMFSIYVTKNINDTKDLKGKTAASMVPGNGMDLQLQYWLKKQGLEPNKDIRIIYSGDNAERLQVLQQGRAEVTILSSPTDLKADELGLNRFALMRDELKTYNHNMIAASGDLIKNKPEAINAFMAVLADAMTFTKDKANRDEVIKIAMDELQMTKADAEKSFEFVLPALADKGKMNIEGVKWAIDTVKETGALKTDISLDKVVDERFYAK